uniref:Uncharacterized protein n=1 Tax=Ananas comosus var. bracteatus TaxID=296719 RepID=A0A6V7PUD8_ANACO|nr:unnamed protein product [Ananas comosus var. bracteatus]
MEKLETLIKLSNLTICIVVLITHRSVHSGRAGASSVARRATSELSAREVRHRHRRLHRHRLYQLPATELLGTVPAWAATRPAPKRGISTGPEWAYVYRSDKGGAAAEDVVAGIILLNGIRVRALFDTGASHFFIDWLFAELHGIPLVSLLHPGRVVVPDHSLDIIEYCPSCPVRVEKWIMPVDLLDLRKLWDFDVVLGMDWLTKYYATIDCMNRTVTFREPRQTEVVFRGCRSSLFAMSISSFRARQLISRGCVTYLASVVLRGVHDTPRI